MTTDAYPTPCPRMGSRKQADIVICEISRNSQIGTWSHYHSISELAKHMCYVFTGKQMRQLQGTLEMYIKLQTTMYIRHVRFVSKFKTKYMRCQVWKRTSMKWRRRKVIQVILHGNTKYLLVFTNKQGHEL